MLVSTAARVRHGIAGFGAGVIFDTSQLLNCGTRNAVDIELCRLVSRRKIERLAAGIFIVRSQDSVLPSVREIATAKANRFGKKVSDSNVEGRAEIFHTDGCSSSFESLHGRLCLKHRAPRKLKQKMQDAGVFKMNQLEGPISKELEPAPVSKIVAAELLQLSMLHQISNLFAMIKELLCLNAVTRSPSLSRASWLSRESHSPVHPTVRRRNSLPMHVLR